MDDLAYNAEEKKLLFLEGQRKVDPEVLAKITQEVGRFAEINNLILETDYYKGK